MADQQDLTTFTYPGDPGISVGPSGGGSCPPWWVPSLSAVSAGAQFDVRMLGMRGNLVAAGLYNVSTSIQGVAALTRTGGSFLGDAEGATEKFPNEPIRAYIAYARGSNINIGRGGDNKPHSNGSYALDFAINDELLLQNNAFAWCLLAGAHYWAVNFFDDVGQTSQDVNNGYLLGALVQYMQILTGRPIDPTPPTGYNAIA
jgi:hypothetical protein